MPTTTASTASVTLTPRERLLNALRGEKIDRVPAWLMRQAGRYLPEYQAVRKGYNFLDLCKTPSAAAEVSVQPVELIGSDAVIIFNDIMLPIENAGAKVEFTEKGPQIRNPLTGAADITNLKTRPITDEEPIVETIKNVRGQVGADFPILGFVGAPWTLASYWIEGGGSRNFENLLKMRWQDPEGLKSILEYITDYAAEYLRIQIEAGADAVQIFDTWGSVLREADYEMFSGQWIRRIIERVSDLGVPVIAYLNGCAPYLEHQATLGADCISIDWRIELADAKKRIGPDTAIQGNLDPLILYTNPDVIDREVAGLFERFPPATGHVFNLGHGILPKTPPANAKALIDAVKRYGTCK